MKQLKIFGMAAALTVAMAVPALAGYVRLGSVDVGYRTDRDSSFTHFAGGLEGLRLTADRSDIYCRNIRVTYANGARDNVFTGMLREDRPTYVDLAGGTRRVARIDFTCRSDRFRGGKIAINGDLGRYQNDWRRDPYWASVWGSIFGNAVDQTFNTWVSLGRETFYGRHDTNNAFSGWGRGRSIDRIGLRPVDGDARCTRVTARFANGSVRNLNGADFLRRGQTTVLDLPGGQRNLVNLDMTCRALGDYRVTIEILARK